MVQPVRGATADVNKHRISNRDLLEAYPEMKIEKVERLFGKVTSILDNCAAYRKSFWLTWNGNLQLCSFADNPAVSVLDTAFTNAWSALLEQLETIESPDQCRDCQYEGFCKRCPGILCAECGSCGNVTETFCEDAKFLYEIYHTEEEK